jgi:hypothetical protein
MKENYFQIYNLTNSSVFKILRIIVFVIPIIWILTSYQASGLFARPLALLVLLIINELFLEFLAFVDPEEKVGSNVVNKIDTVRFVARKKYQDSKSGFDLAESLENDYVIKFFRNVLGMSKIEKTQVGLDEIRNKAFELVSLVE